MTTMKNADTTKSIARSTAMMSGLTLVSRVTGFIRTWAMAFALGNTVLAASFSLANNLPNMIYELVAGGVLSTAFLPIYLQQRNMRSREEGNRYASNLLSLAIIFLGVIALLASIFSPQVMLTQTLFSSSSSETVENAVWLFRFFAFQIIFYGVSAIFGGLLNAEREYFWPAISSVFMNLIIIATFFAYPFVNAASGQAGLLLLAVGTTLSIAVMACVQIPALVKAGFRFRFHIDLHDEGLHETLRLALPAILCTAINLVSLSFMNSCALHVAANGPASVSYAWMWYQFPYGVLGVALSTALFTEMSDCMSHGDTTGFKRHLNLGLRTTCLLIIPMASMLFVCSDELIGLYTAGKFTAADIQPIAELLRGWAFALPLYACYMFVYRAYSSLKDLKTVAICNLVLTFVQVMLYMVFTGVIAIPGFSSLGLVGIACGDIVFYGLMLIVLLYIMRRRMGAFGFGQLGIACVKVIVASVIGGAIAELASWGVAGIVDISNILGSFIALVITGAIGLAIIFAICRILGVSEVTNIVRRHGQRLKHSPARAHSKRRAKSVRVCSAPFTESLRRHARITALAQQDARGREDQ